MLLCADFVSSMIVMEQKLRIAEILPFIEEAFRDGKTFTIPITGTSMLPLLVAGRDAVTLSMPDFPLEKGDLPLYRRGDGSFVLHRVVKIENGLYTMCGDNQFLLEKGIADSAVIGIVSEITRDGVSFSVTEKKYAEYVNRTVRNIGVRYPVRRTKYYLHNLLNGK